MRNVIFTTLFVFLFTNIQAQKHEVENRIQKFPLSATLDFSKIITQWNPQLLCLEMPAPGSETYRRYLIDLKNELYGNKTFSSENNNKQTETNDLPDPSVLTGWEGNPMGSGVPNDNDMAISNGGKIVSVINSSIYIYDTLGTLLQSVYLSTFADTLGIAASAFDPKVMYDPRADKFVLLFLNGFTPETSLITVAFSKTNDPTGEWNFYALPGNPKNDTLWTDFPMFALTEEELFLTINLIIPDEPWQTGFSETLIWQMSLDKGYAGDSLDAVFHDNIFFDGKPIRNLNPVKGGETTYGPEMYFLSNRNFAIENDTIFIVKINGLLDDPDLAVEINYSIANKKYGVPPQARQYLTHIFDTNDGRVLGSFYEDGQIQFVSNSLDPSTGFCGIYHGVITDLEGEKTIVANIIGDDTLDFGYPNISYSGHYDGDNQSIIVFDHTAPTVNAGMSAIYFNWYAYSDAVNIKTGDTYVNVLSGAYERWGDYTGSQRRYNHPGEVWVSGNFGKFVETFPFTSRNNATWIAKLESNDIHPADIVSEENNLQSKVYPNPTTNYFTTEFELPNSGEVEIRIFDMNGKQIKNLLNTQGTKGLNVFSFSMEPLAAGNYILEIRLDGDIYSTIQINKQ